MPAFVKSSVGSSPGTTGLDGTMAWPFDSKNFRNDWRISEAFIGSLSARRASPQGETVDFRVLRPARHGGTHLARQNRENRRASRPPPPRPPRPAAPAAHRRRHAGGAEVARAGADAA